MMMNSEVPMPKAAMASAISGVCSRIFLRSAVVSGLASKPGILLFQHISCQYMSRRRNCWKGPGFGRGRFLVASVCAGTFYTYQICEARGGAHCRRACQARRRNCGGSALSPAVSVRGSTESSTDECAAGWNDGLRDWRGERIGAVANTEHAVVRDDRGAGAQHGEVHVVSRHVPAR